MRSRLTTALAVIAALCAVAAMLATGASAITSSHTPPALDGGLSISSSRSAADAGDVGGSGYTVPGDVLTVSASWTGDPTSLTYQWADCSTSCVDIPGATSASYTVADSDLGAMLDVTVSATNADGTTTEETARNPVVGAPIIRDESSGPYISTNRAGVGGGSADGYVAYVTEGDVLTAAPGTWVGSPSFSYQWERCDATHGCTGIGGATSASYTVQAADLNESLMVAVTGTNEFGTSVWTASNTEDATGTPAVDYTAANDAHLTTSNVNESFADAGDTLTASTGSWFGSPTSYGYQWARCGADSQNCSDIVGATGSTYTLQQSDRGSYVEAVITATNAVGSTSTRADFYSAIGAPVVDGEAPAVTSDHSGDYVTAGMTLTASHGSWLGNPTSFTYQWQRCDSDFHCNPISGATSSSYALTDSDVGQYVYAEVTATNDVASGSEYGEFKDAAVGTPALAAADGSAPTISAAGLADAGGADVGPGDTLSVSQGVWDGSPSSYAYAWKRCTADECTTILGASGTSYTVTDADKGFLITGVVTATNSVGSDSEWAYGVNAGATALTAPASAPVTAPVLTAPLAPQPVVTTTPAGSSMAVPAATAATLALPPATGSVAPATVSWSNATFSVPVTVSASAGAPSTAGGQLTVAGFSAGTVELTLLIKDAAGNELHHFPAPLELVFGHPAPNFQPAYSEDGVTWVAIPKLAGTSLPNGQEDGYYAAADGSVHVLTRHATDFGLLTGLTLWGGTKGVVAHSAKAIVVHLAAGRASTATVSLLTRSGKSLRTVKTELSTEGTAVAIALPKHLKRGRYLVQVKATSSVVSATKTFVISVR